MLIRTIIWVFLFGLSVPALSAGFTGSGINLGSWALEMDSAGYADATGSGAHQWWNRAWGLQGDIVLPETSLQSRDQSQPASLNLEHRLLSTPGNTVISAGIGVQSIYLARHDSRNSLSLSLNGKMGIGKGVTLYGESAWLPGLLETDGVDTLSSLEFETGVMLNPLPNLSIQAAYRRYNLDYTLTGGVADHATSQGFFLGTGLHW